MKIRIGINTESGLPEIHRILERLKWRTEAMAAEVFHKEGPVARMTRDLFDSEGSVVGGIHVSKE